MKEIPYTALVRLSGATDMPVSTFTTAVYQIALDYGVERADVNINGKFEESLQDGNTSFYAKMCIRDRLFCCVSDIFVFCYSGIYVAT